MNRSPCRTILAAAHGLMWAVPIYPRALGMFTPSPSLQLYVTSHLPNRGRLVQDRSTKKPKLNCRNWECGVLFPVIDKAPDSTPSTPTEPGNALNRTMELGESANALDVFKGTIPVPLQLPGRRFGPNIKPWYFSS